MILPRDLASSSFLSLSLSDPVNHRFVAYTWTNSVGKHDEAMSILRAGMEANPSRSVSLSKFLLILIFIYSFLLTFAYAEAQELKKEYEDVRVTFDKLLVTLQTQLERLAAASPPTPPAAGQNGFTDAFGNGTGNGSGTTAGTQSTNTSFNSSSSFEHSGKPETTELTERKAEYGLAYIVYLRFARRTEGVKASRAVFGRARKDRWAPWEVYEAAGVYIIFFACM